MLEGLERAKDTHPQPQEPLASAQLATTLHTTVASGGR